MDIFRHLDNVILWTRIKIIKTFCKHKLSLNENDFFCCDCGKKLLDQLDKVWTNEI